MESESGLGLGGTDAWLARGAGTTTASASPVFWTGHHLLCWSRLDRTDLSVLPPPGTLRFVSRPSSLSACESDWSLRSFLPDTASRKQESGQAPCSIAWLSDRWIAICWRTLYNANKSPPAFLELSRGWLEVSRMS